MAVHWTKELKTMKTYTDQSTGLPQWQSFTLQSPTRTLENFEQFETWSSEVKGILQEQKLLGLIDRELPRPPKKNESGMNWMRVSLQVGEWLKKSIAQDARMDISSLYASDPEEFQFADDVYSGIQCFMMKECVCETFEKARGYRYIPIGAFPDTSSYITAFMKRRDGMIKAGCSSPPFEALMEMLLAIEDRHEDLIDDHLLELELPDGKITNFTEDHLQSAVNKLIEAVEAEER